MCIYSTPAYTLVARGRCRVYNFFADMKTDVVLDEGQKEYRHEKHSAKKQLFTFLFVFFFIILATILIIFYGKGYRFNFQTGGPKISKTGILQIKSIPTGAQVYIDNELKTSTDNSINLSPGKYEVKVSKDGYNDWQKNIQIEREVVSTADVLLLPKSPSLQSISTFGVESVVADPLGVKLAFKIGSSSAKRNGIYVFDMTARVFPVLVGQGSDTQIVDDSVDLFSQSEISWSPDGKEILAVITDNKNLPTYYLLKANGFNQTPQNITQSIEILLEAWELQKIDKENARIKSLNSKVQSFAKENFKILSWSPDENKILYQASSSGQMPVFKKPRLIGNNLLYERRDLEKDAIYVYNIKEDVNTRVIAPAPRSLGEVGWFPDSDHLLYVNDRKINIVEDDGANMTTIYAGPFLDHYVFPWPDGSKIVILTNLGNSTTSPTLYTISLK